MRNFYLNNVNKKTFKNLYLKDGLIMTETINKQTNFKNKSLVVVLSWLSFILCVLGGCLSFLFYKLINDSWLFYYHWLELCDHLCNLLPIILFIVYITKFHNRHKDIIIIPLMFLLLALKNIYYVFMLFPELQNALVYFYDIDIYDTIIIIIYLFLVLSALFCIIAFFSTLKRFSNKTFITIAMLLGILFEKFLFIYRVLNTYYGAEMFLIPAFAYMFGAICMYSAILIFCTENIFFPILKPQKKE